MATLLAGAGIGDALDQVQCGQEQQLVHVGVDAEQAMVLELAQGPGQHGLLGVFGGGLPTGFLLQLMRQPLGS